MIAKLIKTEKGYHLYTGSFDGIHLACYPHDVTKQRLSLKNCQEIERGYDLDELAEQSRNKVSMLFKDGLHPNSHTVGFRAGWQQAMNMMGDKKFSEEDVMLGWDAGVMSKSIIDSNCLGPIKEEKLKEHRDSYRDNLKPTSLQQTEWEVEIEMTKEEYTWTPPGEGFEDQAYRDWREVPKLDADGCLILKRI